MVPKFVSKEKINQRRTTSLFDRQRNILLHAQMHQPANRNEIHSMQKTKFKDWLIREVKQKVQARDDDNTA